MIARRIARKRLTARLRGLMGIVSIVICGTAATAQAQAQSMFGSRGPANQIGSNLTGSPVGRSTTMTSALGSSFGGQAATGRQAGFGSFGQNAGPGGGLMSGTGMAATDQIQPGTAGTQAGFVGRRDNAGRFVGNQLAGQQNGAAATQSPFGGLSNRAGRNAGRSFNQGQDQFGFQSEQTRTVVRPRQRVAFTYPQPTPSAVETRVTTRLTQVSTRQPALRSVGVAVDENGQATLRGEVDSAETSKLAAMMVRLEPGVRSIRNELTVRANQ